jgi:8-oxo-dGTP pyrophosphatase MutT (NUDIX family)
MSLQDWQKAILEMPMTTITRYVLGFAFGSHGRVLLIRKERPAWQRGRMNGLGGKVESGETDAQAMRREFLEECGLDVPENKWELKGSCIGRSFRIAVFSTELSEHDFPVSLTDEQVGWRYWQYVMDSDVLPHVEAMIHCCRMKIWASEDAPFFVFHY